MSQFPTGVAKPFLVLHSLPICLKSDLARLCVPMIMANSNSSTSSSAGVAVKSTQSGSKLQTLLEMSSKHGFKHFVVALSCSGKTRFLSANPQAGADADSFPEIRSMWKQWDCYSSPEAELARRLLALPTNKTVWTHAPLATTRELIRLGARVIYWHVPDDVFMERLRLGCQEKSTRRADAILLDRSEYVAAMKLKTLKCEVVTKPPMPRRDALDDLMLANPDVIEPPKVLTVTAPKSPKPLSPAAPTKQMMEKTQPCKQYAKGLCLYGSACRFSHDGVIPPQAAVSATPAGVSVVVNNAPIPKEKEKEKEWIVVDVVRAQTERYQKYQIHYGTMAVAAAKIQENDNFDTLSQALEPRSDRRLATRAFVAKHNMPSFPDTTPDPGPGFWLHRMLVAGYLVPDVIVLPVAAQLRPMLLADGLLAPKDFVAKVMEHVQIEIDHCKRPVASSGWNYNAELDFGGLSAVSILSVASICVASTQVADVLQGYTQTVDDMVAEMGEFGHAHTDRITTEVMLSRHGRSDLSGAGLVRRAVVVAPMVVGACALLGFVSPWVAGAAVGMTLPAMFRGETNSVVSPLIRIVRPLWNRLTALVDPPTPVQAKHIYSNYDEVVDLTRLNKLFTARQGNNSSPSAPPSPPSTIKDCSCPSTDGASKGSASCGQQNSPAKEIKMESPSSDLFSLELERTSVWLASLSSSRHCSTECSSHTTSPHTTKRDGSTPLTSDSSSSLSSTSVVLGVVNHGSTIDGPAVSKPASAQRCLSADDAYIAEICEIMNTPRQTSSQSQKSSSFVDAIRIGWTKLKSLSRDVYVRLAQPTRSQRDQRVAPLLIDLRPCGTETSMTGSCSTQGLQQKESGSSIPVVIAVSGPNVPLKSIVPELMEPMGPGHCDSRLTSCDWEELTRKYTESSASSSSLPSSKTESSVSIVRGSPSYAQVCQIRRSRTPSQQQQRSSMEPCAREAGRAKTLRSSSVATIRLHSPSRGSCNPSSSPTAILASNQKSSMVMPKSAIVSAPTCSTLLAKTNICQPQPSDVCSSCSLRLPSCRCEHTNSTSGVFVSDCANSSL